MNLADLVKLCLDALEAAARDGRPLNTAQVSLVTAKGWNPPPGFPRGEHGIVTRDGSRVQYFNAERLAGWIMRRRARAGAGK